MALLFRSASEARTELHLQFPNLGSAKWCVKSPCDNHYQCIAWAAGTTDRRWWPWDDPTFYWPVGFSKLPVYSPVPVENFVEVFEKEFGYRRCESSGSEFGYQKVAIYANGSGVTHMARQHFWGRGWLSKLGDMEDILHLELGAVEGDMANSMQYGTVAQVMKRSWWTALTKPHLLRCWWAALRFWFYRRVMQWDLT